MGGGRRRFLADRAPLLGSSGQRLGLSASRFARRCGATVFFSRRNARPTQLRRLSHHGQKPAGAKALVSSSISRRSSSGGFETVRIFAGSDALTRAALGITETQGGRKRRPSFARKWGGGV
jgi:hypothetical protein